MKYEEEFQSVELLIKSELPTKMIDAFSLSLIKAEKQIRKLFTHIAFQSKDINSEQINEMRSVLAGFRNVYFDGFIAGIDRLSNTSLAVLYGDKYTDNLNKINQAIRYRNKIFHGQLTNEKLTAQDLKIIVNNIKEWCKRLAEVCFEHFGYCGFGRNSFQKSQKDITKKLTVSFTNTQEYRTFIRNHMCR